MRRLLRRGLQGAGAAALIIIALGSGPASAGVGTRLANGDSGTSGRCMSITNAGRGTSVEMEPCTTNAHQGWEYRPSEIAATGTIVSQDPDASGRCLTAHAEGVRVTMDRCASYGSSLYTRQVWHELGHSGDWVQFRSVGFGGAGQCLDVRDNGTSNVVQIWQCGPLFGPNVKGNQMWKFF